MRRQNVNTAFILTTRYWDCCKASGSWSGKAAVSAPVNACAKDGITKVDPSAQNVCNGGQSFICNSNQPWIVNPKQKRMCQAAGELAGRL